MSYCRGGPPDYCGRGDNLGELGVGCGSLTLRLLVVASLGDIAPGTGFASDIATDA